MKAKGQTKREKVATAQINIVDRDKGWILSGVD